MITIGICDDEEGYRADIKKHCEEFFRKNPRDHKYLEFSSGDEIWDYSGSQISLLFLDIEMKGVSGLKVLEFFRNRNIIWRIVFVSNHTEQRLDTIDMKTLAFLEKPVSYAGVEKCLTIVIKEGIKNVCISFDTIEGTAEARLGDIIYLEGKRHYVTVFTGSGSFTAYSSMKDCEELFRDSCIVRIHKSYFVNLQYVRKVMSTNIVMSDGMQLPMGRTYANAVKEAHADFIRELALGRGVIR